MQRTKLTIVMLAAVLLFSGCMMERPTVKNYRRVSAMPELTPVTVEQLRQLIAADSVVTKDVPANMVVAGTPAKVKRGIQ